MHLRADLERAERFRSIEATERDKLAAELTRTQQELQQLKTKLDADRIKMNSWVGDLEAIEFDPVAGDPNRTIKLVINSINRYLEK
jgi:hypothetical protein